MKQTVSLTDFRDAFRTMDRKENFSYKGLEILFDYLEEMEQCGEELELDVIALCCDFYENDVATIAQDYSIDLSDIDESDDDELKDAVREYLQDNTSLIGETDNSFIYAAF
jgi:hypothetical protein